jgi:hypothetical protein
LFGTAQYNASIPLFKEVIDRSPQSFSAYLSWKGLTAAYELTDRHADAQWTAQNVMRIIPNFTPTLQKPEGKQHGKIDPILRIHHRNEGKTARLTLRRRVDI